MILKSPVFNYIEYEDCCGCSACSQVCPASIISMEKDSEGFLYPRTDISKCINCGKCVNACPIVNSKSNLTNRIEKEQILYAGYAKKEDTVLEGSSGGIFEILAMEFLKKYKDNSYVVGAAWSDDFKHVNHCFASSYEGIVELRTSKYIQSEKNDCYKRIKELLKQGCYILFVGTPCEVSGLKKYLNKEYDNLLSVDFICKGPTSQLFLDEYIDFLNKKYRSNVSYLNMRYKWNNIDIWIPQFIMVKFSNGRERLREFYNTYIGHAFRIVQRPSCYNCKYIGFNKKSDITLGDYHGIKNSETFFNNKGTSLIVLNSLKGEHFFDSVKQKLFLVNVSKEKICNDNPKINEKNVKNKEREHFIEVFKKEGIKKAVLKTISMKEKCKLFIHWKIQRKLIKSKRK